MVFVELTPFVRFHEEHWTDDELRALQRFLLVTPGAGDVIRGTGGLRKLRWSASGRGKRGGARVIYYLQTSADRIYLVYGYVKAKGRLDAPAAQAPGSIDEGSRRWISNTLINWCAACAK